VRQTRQFQIRNPNHETNADFQRAENSKFLKNNMAPEFKIESMWKAFMPTAQWLPEYKLGA
jgi:hypothetical protein